MRRKPNPLAALAVVIAVAVVAWWTGNDKPAQTQTPQPQTPQKQAPRTADRAPRTQTPRTEQRTPPTSNEEQAQLEATLALIDRGGPFPYRQDGATFQNRERRLPQQPQGYYREYTVPTPGASNRGARRVVRGRSGETWYTRDHYKTFIRLD